MFKVTRIYNDENGESHFDELDVQLYPGGMIGRLSEPIPVKSMILREVDASYDWNFHTAPQRQYIILLDGEIEIETSLGQKRQFSGGDVLLVEDTTGKGHRTRNLQPHSRKSIFITI
jgi:hypothetical protein